MIQNTTLAAIVNCAGRSERFGSNKLLATIGGTTVLERTVRCFTLPIFDEVVVTVSERDQLVYRSILGDAGLDVTLVVGAEERFRSAERGLAATTADLVLVHDGVRPFVTAAMIEEVVRCGLDHGAAMLGLPSVVQAKVVDGDEFVTGSLDREHTWLGQTPQVFDRCLLQQSYARAIAANYALVSDDADLVALYTGHPIKMIRGDENNIKLTTPRDLFVAQHIALGLRA